MNNALYRAHRLLYVFFACLAAVVAIKGMGLCIPNLSIAVIHYFAAEGTRDGKYWGKILSRIIATIMLLGFPIGTVIGIYLLMQTGKKWESNILPRSEVMSALDRKQSWS